MLLSNTIMRSVNAPASSKSNAPARKLSLRFLSFVFLLIFSLSLAGISSRHHGLLAIFWPTNAVLLGLLLKHAKHTRLWPLWLTACSAHICAELLTGHSLGLALILSSIQVISISVAYYLLHNTIQLDLHLRRPHSLLQLFLIAAFASLVSAIPGGLVSQQIFGNSYLYNASLWFVAEQLAYSTLLPAMLCAPRFTPYVTRHLFFKLKSLNRYQWAPFLALCCSAMLGLTLGGTGAVAFPVLPLLWCALSYSLFCTSLLSLLFVGWTLCLSAIGIIPSELSLLAQDESISLHLGILSIALAPMVTASITASRNDAVRKLRYLAEHDSLTGLLNQQTFYQQAQTQLDWYTQTHTPHCMLILDLDHFKQVNDNYGHTAGDLVIQTVAKVLRAELRDGDIAGRVGGEEFSVLLSDCDPTQANNIAERIRLHIAKTPITLKNGHVLQLTTSIGIAHAQKTCELNKLLHKADKALYRAKANGRNCCHIYNASQDKTILN